VISTPAKSLGLYYASYCLFLLARKLSLNTLSEVIRLLQVNSDTDTDGRGLLKPVVCWESAYVACRPRVVRTSSSRVACSRTMDEVVDPGEFHAEVIESEGINKKADHDEPHYKELQACTGRTRLQRAREGVVSLTSSWQRSHPLGSNRVVTGTEGRS
jgi:hypothetical protein